MHGQWDGYLLHLALCRCRGTTILEPLFSEGYALLLPPITCVEGPQGGQGGVSGADDGKLTKFSGCTTKVCMHETVQCLPTVSQLTQERNGTDSVFYRMCRTCGPLVLAAMLGK